MEVKQFRSLKLDGALSKHNYSKMAYSRDEISPPPPPAGSPLSSWFISLTALFVCLPWQGLFHFDQKCHQKYGNIWG